MALFKSLIDTFKSGTYTVTRSGATTLVKGRPTAGASTTFDVEASVQPLTGKDTQSLPEGFYTTNTLVVFTRTKLNPVSSADSDRINIRGEDYDVMNVEYWEGWSGIDDTYYRILCRKVG